MHLFWGGVEPMTPNQAHVLYHLRTCVWCGW